MGKLLDKLRRVQAGGRPFCTMIVPAAGSAASTVQPSPFTAVLHGAVTGAWSMPPYSAST